MRSTPLGLVFCLAACGSSGPGVDAAPAAPPVEAVIVHEAAPSTRTVPVGHPDGRKERVASPSMSVEGLTGRWRVTAVEVASGLVSAVDVDDTRLLGAILSITPERLAWEPHEGGFFTDTCLDPWIGPNGRVRCAGQQFGPPDMRIVRRNNRLRLPWYDGAILLLSRVS